MSRYRKKPVVVEAVQFTGGNERECMAFCPSLRRPAEAYPNVVIPTLEGDHLCRVGWWIIKGVAGEFYPCEDSIFQATYEPVDG